jgi:hypothetical protein
MRSEFPLQQREHAKPKVQTPVMNSCLLWAKHHQPVSNTADSLSLFTLLSFVGLLLV